MVTSVTEIRGDCACMTLIYGGKKKSRTADPRRRPTTEPRERQNPRLTTDPRRGPTTEPLERQNPRISADPRKIEIPEHLN